MQSIHPRAPLLGSKDLPAWGWAYLQRAQMILESVGTGRVSVLSNRLDFIYCDVLKKAELAIQGNVVTGGLDNEQGFRAIRGRLPASLMDVVPSVAPHLWHDVWKPEFARFKSAMSKVCSDVGAPLTTTKAENAVAGEYDDELRAFGVITMASVTASANSELEHLLALHDFRDNDAEIVRLWHAGERRDVIAKRACLAPQTISNKRNEWYDKYEDLRPYLLPRGQFKKSR